LHPEITLKVGEYVSDILKGSKPENEKYIYTPFYYGLELETTVGKPMIISKGKI
jgi:hypothetical protein